MRTLTCLCSVVFLVLGIFGCGGPQGGGGSSRSDARIRHISTKKLPKLAATNIAVDDGRLEVAPPAKWQVPPRDRRWLVRFQADLGSSYPMIFVTTEDSDAMVQVTPENLEKFAAQVRKELLANSSTKRLAQGLQPVVVGDFHGALYQRWGKSDGRVMERWMLETVANGRRYTLELRSREGLAEEYLPHLYAVASGLKFVQGQDAASAAGGKDEGPNEGEKEDAKEEESLDAP